MSILLTSGDAAQLRGLLAALNSPLAYPDDVAWRCDVLEQAGRLLGGDRGSFYLQGADEAIVAPAADSRTGAEYLAYFHVLDPAPGRRRAQRQTVFGHRTMFVPGEVRTSEFYNDFLVPHRVQHSAGAVVPEERWETELAWLVVHGEWLRDAEHERRALQLLELAQPALYAGVETVRRLRRNRRDICTMLDEMAGPAVLCDAAGAELHANSALREHLAAEPDELLLHATIGECARGALRAARPVGADVPAALEQASGVTVRTAQGSYHVRASVLQPGLVAGREAVLVTVQPLFAPLRPVAVATAGFGLTARQAEVALLLARGLSAKAIAQELGIRWHTVRRHIEAISGRLGVSSRAEVVYRLLGGPPPPGVSTAPTPRVLLEGDVHGKPGRG